MEFAQSSIAAGLAILGVTLSVSGCAASVPVDDPVADSENAILRGTFDSSNKYPYVGHMRVGTGSCSATLITPRWVLTATHCFGNQAAGDRRGMDASFVFAPDATSRSTTVVRAQHTFARSGAVLTRFNPTELPADGTLSRAQSAADIALVRLDEPISTLRVKPMHVAGTGLLPCSSQSSVDCTVGEPAEGPCPDRMTNPLLVGYGPHGTSIDDALDGKRYWSTWGSWARVTDGLGVYLISASYPGSYRGPGRGDSGGPLIMSGASPKRVCGVTSAGGLADHDLLTFLGLDDRKQHAVYTSVEAHAAWITQAIWDPATLQYDGECVMRAGLTDSDGDALPDVCDRCPSFKSSLNGDEDGDGIGDVCDNCVAEPNPDQRNGNEIAEFEIRGAVDPTEQARAAGYLTQVRPGDACDTATIAAPRPSPDLDAYPPQDPAAIRQYPRRFSRAVRDLGRVSCTAIGAPLENAPVHVNNVVELEGIAPPYAVSPVVPTIQAHTMVEHCSCAPERTDAECNNLRPGSENCNIRRSRVAGGLTNFQPSSVQDVSPETGGVASWGLVRPTFDRRLRPAGEGERVVTTHARSTRPTPASVRKVAWAYWRDPDMTASLPPVPAPQSGSYDRVVWNGIVSAWVHSFGGAGRGAPTFQRGASAGSDDDQTLRTSWSRIALREFASDVDDSRCAGSTTPLYPVQDIIGQACPMCARVPSLINPVVQPANAVSTVTAGSNAPIATGVTVNSITANAFLTANATVVAADAWAAPAGAPLGVVLAPSGTVTATLLGSPSNVRTAVPAVRTLARPGAAPLAWVARATRSELAAVFADRVEHRRFDGTVMATNSWSSGFRFADVKGAFYNLASGLDLVVDAPNASSLRLTSVPRFGSPVVVAEWTPLRRAEAIRVDLSPSGDLLITSARASAARTTVIHLAGGTATSVHLVDGRVTVGGGVALTAAGVDRLVSGPNGIERVVSPLGPARAQATRGLSASALAATLRESTP